MLLCVFLVAHVIHCYEGDSLDYDGDTDRNAVVETEDITGIDYEPWHYRYVGKEVAKQFYEEGITLEEYVGKRD